ncbi:MAG: hypothetical protein IJ084_04565 [Prevotella sp.]|nr:hypothetical protein [Prevotella sp.]
MFIKSLLIKHITHLPIYSTELAVVAVLSGGVGTLGGHLEILQSHGRLVEIMIGTPQKVVGEHLFVRGTVIIEIISQCLRFCRGAKDAIRLIESTQPMQAFLHLSIPLPRTPHHQAYDGNDTYDYSFRHRFNTSP